MGEVQNNCRRAPQLRARKLRVRRLCASHPRSAQPHIDMEVDRACTAINYDLTSSRRPAPLAGRGGSHQPALQTARASVRAFCRWGEAVVWGGRERWDDCSNFRGTIPAVREDPSASTGLASQVPCPTQPQPSQQACARRTARTCMEASLARLIERRVTRREWGGVVGGDAARESHRLLIGEEEGGEEGSGDSCWWGDGGGESCCCCPGCWVWGWDTLRRGGT